MVVDDKKGWDWNSENDKSTDKEISSLVLIDEQNDYPVRSNW